MTRGTRHEIDPNQIDEVDEVDGDEALRIPTPPQCQIDPLQHDVMDF
jgi:hypothetical protein